MAMQYDGKTYRNLQEQVAYLTGKWKELADEIEELRAQIPSKMIVEELPETGDPLITYYVGPKGTAPNQYYEVWIWVQEEPEGPFVWRELEDTDQVDLSGYLEKVEDATPLPQVYGKTEAGDQVMVNMDIAATAATVLFRDTNGRTKVAAPSADGDAANKKYCDDGFVAKQTGATTFQQAYVKHTDGSQGMVDIDAENETANTLVQRTSGGKIVIATPTAAYHGANKKYVDDNFIAKQTGTTYFPKVYGKNADGSQEMVEYSSTVRNDAIVRRNASGQVLVPNTPTDGSHAASKAYVDAAVGQLLYLHDIEIIVTVDATNKLYVKAFLINDDSTAITTISSSIFTRMNVQYGCFGPDVQTGTPCAVAKLPYSFIHDLFETPNPSYLYQYISGGSLVSGETDYSMTVTFTDSVISF